MILTSELKEAESDTPLVPLLSDALVSIGAEVKASLAIEYERKGYKERCSVYPATSPYRQDSQDSYVLTIEVTVPMRFAKGHLFTSVAESKEALKSLAEASLQTRKDALQAELEKVNEQMGNL